MTHYELCEKTAKWAIKKYASYLALYEYQSFASGEHPDVLLYAKNTTILFEIKMSRSDFEADSKKEARKKWKPKVGLFGRGNEELFLQAKAPELYYIEAPHLGVYRYYVCPWGLINSPEIPEGWGLYWERGNRFFQQKKSNKWRADVRTERNLVGHAFRRYASGDNSGILIDTYERH